MTTLIRHHGGFTVALSVLVALMLSIVPLPEWLEAYRPEWPVLVLIYWGLAVPQRIGVGYGWLTGLLIDVLKGGLLGQHALALSVVMFLTLNLHQRIRVYPLWQQALSILMLNALYQLLILWFDGITGQSPKGWDYWMPSLTGMLLWPWVFLVLRDLRRRFKVS